MTDAQKLKPCPFCRGIARIGGEALYVSARCSKCSATVGWVLKPGEEADAVISAWNTRADLIDMDVLRSVEAASRPFVAAVFNDNGDVTVSTGHLTTGRWLKLCAAITALRAMMEKLK